MRSQLPLEARARTSARQWAARINNASAGRVGARVALRTEKRARIVDFEACLQLLKDQPEIIDLVQTLAQRAVRGGVKLPGVEIDNVEVAA